jgi:hypothetical protein
MPAEVSIAKQLSGPECLEACVSALRSTLVKDDRFMPHMAYHGFTADIVFKFTPHNSFAPPVERTLEVKGGEQGMEQPSAMFHVELPLRPPNQVREEAQLPTPVLVADDKGQAHEEWKKTGSVPKQSPVPKNKIKGV